MTRALRGALAVAVLACTVAVAANAATQGWRIVARAHSSGSFAATAASATVNHPRALAVRLSGRGVSGFAAVACTKGFSIGSKSTQYRGAGLHVLKLPFGSAESCDITASIGGMGSISLQILAR